MTTPMGHEEARDLLAAFALDGLDSVESARVLDHVATCESCAAELKELRAAASAIAFAPPSPADAKRAAAVKERLMARVRSSKEATLAPPAVVQRSGTFANRAAIAATVLFVASSALSITLWRDRTDLRSALVSLTGREAASTHAADSLRGVLSERDQLIAGLTGRDMAFVRLTSSGTREAWALMFWNRQSNAWTFVAHNLPKLAAGRTYQLWLVTASAKISAGTFAPGASGEAVVRANYELPRDALKAVAVTEEPAGGVAQPTGGFVVIGGLQ